MAFVAAAYFVVILKVAPYYATRYIVIIEPWVCVLFIFILDRLRQSFRMSWKGFFFALCLLIALSAHKMYYDMDDVIASALAMAGNLAR